MAQHVKSKAEENRDWVLTLLPWCDGAMVWYYGVWKIHKRLKSYGVRKWEGL